jgi:plasmid stabilization system protein ParE
MREIVWSIGAKESLRNCMEYIARDSERIAEEWALDIIESVDRVAEFPESGTVPRDITDDRIREIVKGNYRIVYEFSEERIDVLIVRNVRQNSTFDD